MENSISKTLKTKSSWTTMNKKAIYFALLLYLFVSMQGLSALAQTTPGTLSEEECICSCITQAIPTDEEEKQAFIESEKALIQRDLFVDSKKLSSEHRKRNSAEDDRPSARNVGAVGIAMMGLFVCVILVFDSNYFFSVGTAIKNTVNKRKVI